MSGYSDINEKIDRRLYFAVPIVLVLLGIALIPLIMIAQGSFEFTGWVWVSVIPMVAGITRLFWRW
jgi:hypothetical protein